VATCSRHPRAPKKTLEEHTIEQSEFLDGKLNPRLEEARQGQRHVFFVDAAHMVYGTFLCCLWSLVRLYVRAASGRQRFNVLGALNALTQQVIAVTNTTVVNKQTMCELLHKIAAQGLVEPVTVVLDNARYQRNQEVEDLAKTLNIELLFLPGYSPNLNLIERLWKFVRKEALQTWHESFEKMQEAVAAVLDNLSDYQEQLRTLMTERFHLTPELSTLVVGQPRT
jgi:transposase